MHRGLRRDPRHYALVHRGATPGSQAYQRPHRQDLASPRRSYMTPSRDERLLDYAAQRAKAHPDYLGWVLTRYVERERISEAELASCLGSTPHDLHRLALCLRPRAEHFADDIRQISTKFQIDATALAGVVRRVE